MTHSLVTSTAEFHDSRIWDELLHGEETSVWADKGYVGAEREAAFADEGKVWGGMRTAPKCGKLHPEDAKINRIIAMVRGRVEHPFHVLKRQFGYVKTRCRGLAKNRAQLFPLFALCRAPVSGVRLHEGPPRMTQFEKRCQGAMRMAACS